MLHKGLLSILHNLSDRTQIIFGDGVKTASLLQIKEYHRVQCWVHVSLFIYIFTNIFPLHLCMDDMTITIRKLSKILLPSLFLLAKMKLEIFPLKS